MSRKGPLEIPASERLTNAAESGTGHLAEVKLAMHVFYQQVHDFCRLMHEVLPRKAGNVPDTITSASAVQDFTDKFILCPGTDAARRCIERDFAGALGFAQAVDGVNRQLQMGGYQLPRVDSAPQTRFFVLGSAVQDYLQTVPA